MNTPSNQLGPAYTSSLLWLSIVALGLANVALQLARRKDFMDRDDWTWLEFAVGMCTLALVVWAIVSFVRTRQRRRE